MLGSTRRVLEPPCLWLQLLKPRVRGVEFGDRGIEVIDVEPHL